MSIQEDVKGMIMDAMRAKDTVRKDVLKGISAGFTNEMVAQKKTPSDPVDDEMALTVIKRQVKQRKDSIEQFTAGGRPELAEKESAELAILEAFLPAQMSEEEIVKIVDEKMAELSITDKSGFGQLIGAVVKATGGNADGNLVKTIIEGKLA